MDRSDEIRRLAVEVMGWEPFTMGYWGTSGDLGETERMRELSRWIEEVGMDEVGDYWINAKTDFFKAVEGFNPFSNLSDAFMVAERIGYLNLMHGKPENFWYANFNGTEFVNLTRNGKTPAEAISRAAIAWLSAREGK